MIIDRRHWLIGELEHAAAQMEDRVDHRELVDGIVESSDRAAQSGELRERPAARHDKVEESSTPIRVQSLPRSRRFVSRSSRATASGLWPASSVKIESNCSCVISAMALASRMSIEPWS